MSVPEPDQILKSEDTTNEVSGGRATALVTGILGLLTLPALSEAQEPVLPTDYAPPARVQAADPFDRAVFGVQHGTLAELASDDRTAVEKESAVAEVKVHAPEWDNVAVQQLIANKVLTESQCEDLHSNFNPLTLVYLWGFMTVEEAFPTEPEKLKDFITFAHAYLLGDAPVSLAETDEPVELCFHGDALVEWQRRVYSIGVVSPETLKKDFTSFGTLEAASERAISVWLDTFDHWKKDERPLQALRNKLHTFYCLQSVVTSDQQERMFAQFAKTETQLRSFDRRELREYLNAGIEFDREQNLEDRKALLTIGEDLLKLLKENSEFTCIEDIAVYSPVDGPFDNTVWQVEHLADFSSQDYVTLRNIKDSRTFITVSESEFESAVRRDNVEALVAEASERNDREQQALAGLREVHFPEGQEVTYLRVFQRKADPTLAYTYLDSMFFGLGLEHSYGDQIKVAVPVFADEPLSEIRERLAEIAASTDGKFTVFLDLYCHGSPTELAFPTAMHGTDLIELTREFPDCTFVTSSIACFGGGVIDEVEGMLTADLGKRTGWFVTRAHQKLEKSLRKLGSTDEEWNVQDMTASIRMCLEGVQRAPAALAEVADYLAKDVERLGYDREDIKSRLTVFTQTTRRVTNKLATISDNQEESYLAGTPHQREAVKILLEGQSLPIGEVFFKADQAVQRYRDLDGEVIFEGQRAHYVPETPAFFNPENTESRKV